MQWEELLFWGIGGAIFLAGGLTWERLRGGRYARTLRAMQAAVERCDWPTVIDRCRALLRMPRDPHASQRIRLVLCSALGWTGRHDLALKELRALQDWVLATPFPRVTLHHAIAYHLALTGEINEALAALKRAEDLLAMPVPAVEQENARSTAAEARGTRGIIHFHDGKLDEAERDLQSALEMQPEGKQRAALDAERWWWLAEISRKRGREEEARLRLENAAVHFKTEFGSRAAVALGRPAAH